MTENYPKAKILFWLLVISGFFIWPIFVFGAANDVVINEIMIGQTGAARNEFIELYNPTGNNIDLTGYKLKKKIKSGSENNLVSSSKFVGIIPAYGYFLITHPNYKDIINADLPYSGSSYYISSNNTIILYDQEDNVIDKVGYGEEASDFEGQASIEPENNQSIERQPIGQDSDNNSIDFVVQDTPSPQNSGGQEFLPPEEPDEEPPPEEPEADGWIPQTVVNQPPIADAGLDITALVNQEISFDGSLSYDPDNDTLTYFWNFGDGATETEEKASHIYLFSGQYIVTLMVSDEEFSDLDIIMVNIYNQSVIISEFIPNPTGSDTENEWIELFNQSEQIANLTNWQLDDQEDGSSPFVFPANSLIAPKQFLVIRQPISKISLNNDQDQVRLLYPDGSLATEVSYSGEKEEGLSVAFDGLDYFWTKIPTPGSANIISDTDLGEKNENISSNNPQPIIQQTQEAPEILANLNLNPSQEFSTLNPAQDSSNLGLQDAKESTEPTESDQSAEKIAEGLIEFQSQQAASLAQTSQSSQKANLILTLSIIISGSLLVSWLLIQLRKRLKT